MVSGHLVLFAHEESVVEGVLRVTVFGGDAALDDGEAQEFGAVVSTFLFGMGNIAPAAPYPFGKWRGGVNRGFPLNKVQFA